MTYQVYTNAPTNYIDVNLETRAIAIYIKDISFLERGIEKAKEMECMIGGAVQ